MNFNSSPEECHNVCFDDPACTGYTTTDGYYPGYCWIHGNFDNLGSFSDDKWVQYSSFYFTPSETNIFESVNVKCFRRTIQPQPNAVGGMNINSSTSTADATC